MKKESYLRFWLIYIGLVLACVIYLAYVQIHSDNYVFFSQKDSSGRYRIEISQINGPEKPHGSTYCDIFFYEGEELLFRTPEYVLSNGRLLHESMVHVKWGKEEVEIKIYGDQVSGPTYHLRYDGEYSREYESNKAET